jgi:cyanophycin synthetase
VWFALRRRPPAAARAPRRGRRGLVRLAARRADPRPRRARDRAGPGRRAPELPRRRGRAQRRNALAAAALASALGLPDAAIVAGLRSFTSSIADNPGRANLARVGEVLVFLDFAHNPAGIRSIRACSPASAATARLLISIGVAGDRRDDDIREVARAVHELGPDQVRVRDLEDYLRGRAPGEVPALLRRTLLEPRHAGDAVDEVRDEVDVLRAGLAWARPGDVVAILVHVERDEIQAELQRSAPRLTPGRELSPTQTARDGARPGPA